MFETYIFFVIKFLYATFFIKDLTHDLDYDVKFES